MIFFSICMKSKLIKSISNHQPDDSFRELQAIFLLSTDILISVLFVKTEIIYPIVSSQARAH